VLLSGILETTVESGYLQVSPARGVKLPQKGRREKPAIIAGEDFLRLLQQNRSRYSRGVTRRFRSKASRIPSVVLYPHAWAISPTDIVDCSR